MMNTWAKDGQNYFLEKKKMAFVKNEMKKKMRKRDVPLIVKKIVEVVQTKLHQWARPP